MSIFGFLYRNHGRHESCSGCHWHVVTSGWRCCACRKSSSSRRPRPTDTGECRLDRNSTPTGAVAGQQPRNRVTDDDAVRWLGELTAPAEDTVALPGTGRRRLGARNHVNRSRPGRAAST